MRIDREQLVDLLHGEGDNDRADAVARELPEQIDTDRDAEALDRVGLDQATLQGKLATGGIGGNLQI